MCLKLAASRDDHEWDYFLGDFGNSSVEYLYDSAASAL